jgi:hypothetical protein
MRVIIAGSRGFTDYVLVSNIIDKTLKDNPELKITEIISGGARGIDTLAIRYAKEHNMPYKVYPAEWDAYGKSAGYRRNEVMSNNSDALIAIWDGISKGTRHMIDISNNKGLIVKVVVVK